MIVHFVILHNLYPGWSHLGKAIASYAEGFGLGSRQGMNRFVLCKWRSLGGTLSTVGETASQLDLSSLTPLSISCGRLQLGVAHWATSVALLQVVHNTPDKQWYEVVLWGTPRYI